MTTAKIVVPKAATDTEAEYESVLVAVDVGRFTPQIVATATKLAARGGRGIYVLVTDHRAATAADRRRAARARRRAAHRSSSRPGGSAGGACAAGS